MLDVTKSPNTNNNIDPSVVVIKKSFSELSSCLNKYKEIVPFLNNKLENVEKENKILKEQINRMNLNENLKKDEMIKFKEKEIEDLKNKIKKINNDKEKLEKDNNIMKTENNLMKNDIALIGNTISSGINNNQNKKNENDNLINELLDQLMKARNIISVLKPEK